MRVNINLASRKVEDVHRFYTLWRGSLSAMAVLTIVLAVLAYLKYTNDSQTAVEARDLQQKITALQRERNELRAFENLPENREVTQQKQFWNSQILKRSFSWTLLFNELQRIMPARAYLNSVSPELTKDNRLKLKLEITGDHKGNDIELVERMESSKHFHSTRVVDEQQDKSETKGPVLYKFQIETYYTPSATPSANSATTSKGGA